MSLFESYDESDEIVKAEVFAKNLKKLPQIAIVCFKKELMNIVKEDNSFKEYSSVVICGETMPIYMSNVNGKEFIIYRTPFGAPATVAIMEEMIARGVKKFIFFGSCGVLDEEISHGAFIIPNKAYRDEGTSYHYLPVSDYIDVDTYDEISKIFDINNIKYEVTGTWTTDAVYKETKDKMKRRLNDGYKVVEMECASVMAVCKVRGVEAYYFLYTDDTLAGEEWKLRTLKEDRRVILNECLKIAYKIIDEIIL